jgi:hypothetical protein
VSSAADFTLVNNPRLQFTNGELSPPSRDSELPASSETSVTTETGRDRGGEPRRNFGVGFFLQNIGVARSNIARTTIVLMKDMWMLPTAQREYASGLCLSDTEKMRVVLTRCYIRPGFNVELHFYSNRDWSAHS